MKIMNLNELGRRSNSTPTGRANSESTTIVSTELIAQTGTRGNTTNPIYQHQQQQKQQQSPSSTHSHDHSHNHSHDHDHHHN